MAGLALKPGGPGAGSCAGPTLPGHPAGGDSRDPARGPGWRESRSETQEVAPAGTGGLQGVGGKGGVPYQDPNIQSSCSR